MQLGLNVRCSGEEHLVAFEARFRLGLNKQFGRFSFTGVFFPMLFLTSYFLEFFQLHYALCSVFLRVRGCCLLLLSMSRDFMLMASVRLELRNMISRPALRKTEVN